VETRKIFVLDTSVLVYHEDSIHAFPDNEVVIPIEVLEEIDSLKKRDDPVGNAARYVNRFLDDLRSSGSLKDGVEMENGQIIRVSSQSDMSILPPGFVEKNDNKIISVALKLSREFDNVVLISRDINIRVKCDSLGIKSENYIKEKATISRREAYSGVTVLELGPEDVQEFYDEGSLYYGRDQFFPNEFLVVKGGQKSALGIFKNGAIQKLRYTSGKSFNVQGISPRNKEQTFALEMLLDKDIHMVTMSGKAGSGKTLLAIAAAIQMLNEKRYEKIILSRPALSMSKEIGFLPGTLEEKMMPWLQPFFDNLKQILPNGKAYIDMMIEKEIIEIGALSYIRGRSLPNTIFIVDEAQNITHNEAKAIITRMGENSKLILIGDLEQIDAPHLDSTTSGLGSVVEKFKDFELSAHITLLKGERSPLAAHAAKIL
jgi:PhoH-like ATPase